MSRGWEFELVRVIERSNVEGCVASFDALKGSLRVGSWMLCVPEPF